MYKGKKILFASDLDKTLIHSYKVAGSSEICVERMGNKALSYMSPYAYENLQLIQGLCAFAPITTRSIEQYRRLNLTQGRQRYAVTSNGGVLLVDGAVDAAWLNESKALIRPAAAALAEGRKLLEADEAVCFEVRLVDELFLFTKSSDSEATLRRLQQNIELSHVRAFTHGEKVYLIPNALNKGSALQRLCGLLQPDDVISAGDSVFDLPMLALADLRFVPDQALGDCLPSEGTRVFSAGQTYFADMITEEILQILTS